MKKHPSFTMSMFSNAEALYKAKAEYFENVANEREIVIMKLDKTIERMGKNIRRLEEKTKA